MIKPPLRVVASLCGAFLLVGCATKSNSSRPVMPRHDLAATPAPSVAMTADARAALTRIRATADNHGGPFMVIDKKKAHVWVFDGKSQPVGDAPVLLGKALGDHSVSGIGDKPLAQIKESERTTPAGRFVIEPGRNAHGDNVLWIDYDAAVSMHVIRAADRGEHRAERLASPTPDDNRISYGCINVDARFFDAVLDRSFGPGRSRQPGIAYVLPETQPAFTLFEAPVLSAR